ncbi:HAD domain-containing protein [Planotetraspora phitsanulokensis]|uniref:Secreted protein n=1 Tax=Planotetraspora phitsanulokensis TaxID=575192 RepID=A0A8J3XCS2_9ACTN|nr:HAD domain-containing protein [Planotetraspora phitsanulokensis]GII36320.1 hypothetical protein Pph01_13230 [Planotetraspora phitsanulokensis]
MRSKPLLLLDVDGVLNPSRRSSLRYRRHICVVDGGLYKLLLDRRHGPQLLSLARDTGAELVWATTWEEHANVEIAPRVGLPRLPVIRVTGDPVSKAGEHFKTGAVADYVDGRPFVWFDDGLTTADHDYLRAHEGVDDFLLVHVDARHGLGEDHLTQAREWLSTFASRRPGDSA